MVSNIIPENKFFNFNNQNWTQKADGEIVQTCVRNYSIETDATVKFSVIQDIGLWYLEVNGFQNKPI